MVYINTAEGTNATLTGPISVAIPTEFVQEKMQLYKGEVDAQGSINWNEAKSMDGDRTFVALNEGLRLFNENCARCHSISRDLMGPALLHVASRSPSKELMYAFTRHSYRVLETGNRYYNCLFEKWNRTPKPVFQLSDEELDNLYAYIDNESRKISPVPTRSSMQSCYDSCEAYEKASKGLVELRETLIIDNGPLTAEEHTNFTISPLDSCLNCPLKKLVPACQNATYYQFKIESFGWSNIDMLMERLSESKQSKLTVNVAENADAAFDIFLVIPEYKSFQQGGPLDAEPDTYGFYDIDGNIYYPHGKRAWVFALGEGNDEILFGKASFETGAVNNLQLALRKISGNELEQEILSMSMDSLRISVADSKNASGIRKIDAAIKTAEDLKPKTCDCGRLISDSTAPGRRFN